VASEVVQSRKNAARLINTAADVFNVAQVFLVIAADIKLVSAAHRPPAPLAVTKVRPEL
jgi:hypothetical protein